MAGTIFVTPAPEYPNRLIPEPPILIDGTSGSAKIARRYDARRGGGRLAGSAFSWTNIIWPPRSGTVAWTRHG